MHTHSPGSTPITTGQVIHWARWYDVAVRLLTFGKAQKLRNHALDRVRLAPNAAVLDIGCGTGDLCIAAKSRLAPEGSVVGIDAAPEMVEYARRKATRAHLEIDFQHQVAEHLAFADQSFDVVLSSLMMHHLPDSVKRAALSEAWRVLRPHGQVAIVDFRRPTSRWTNGITTVLLHRHLTTGLQDLVGLVEQAGFGSIEQHRLNHGVFGVLVATKSAP